MQGDCSSSLPVVTGIRDLNPLFSLSIQISNNSFKLTMNAANSQTPLTNCSIKLKTSVTHLVQVLVCCLAVSVSVVIKP